MFKKEQEKKFFIVLITLFFIIITPIFCIDLFAPFAPDMTDWDNIYSPPNFSELHFFGTDSLGRDIFVRTLYGARTSLLSSIFITLISLIIGTTFGVISGFYGGKTDEFMMRIVDILYSLPNIFFIILLVTFIETNLLLIFIAIGLISWLDIARIVRGQTLHIKSSEYILAAISSGASHLRILLKYILPNLSNVIVVYTTLLLPQIILTESFLSFLGLGHQEPSTSLGSLINDGANNITFAWWSLIFPALMLIFLLFYFNAIGDKLNKALILKEKN